MVTATPSTHLRIERVVLPGYQRQMYAKLVAQLRHNLVCVPPPPHKHKPTCALSVSFSRVHATTCALSTSICERARLAAAKAPSPTTVPPAGAEVSTSAPDTCVATLDSIEVAPASMPPPNLAAAEATPAPGVACVGPPPPPLLLLVGVADHAAWGCAVAPSTTCEDDWGGGAGGRPPVGGPGRRPATTGPSSGGAPEPVSLLRFLRRPPRELALGAAAASSLHREPTTIFREAHIIHSRGPHHPHGPGS